MESGQKSNDRCGSDLLLSVTAVMMSQGLRYGETGLGRWIKTVQIWEPRPERTVGVVPGG